MNETITSLPNSNLQSEELQSKLPVIKDKQGNIIPYVDYKNSGIINSYWMGYREYSELEELFCQRDTEGRFNKAKKYLQELLPEHAVVTIGVLTEDDVVNGVQYKKGTRFRIDSNTRAFTWANGSSDSIPKDVMVIEFSFSSFSRLKKCYDTFDSISATEKNQEKFYGIITGMCGYEPVSKKVKKGIVVTALNFVSVCYQPNVYKSKAPVTESIPGQTFYFLEEIKAFDKLIIKEGNWNQTWVAAALMSMKKYGTTNERLQDGLLRLDGKKSDTMSDDWDGMTKIIEEWKSNEFLGEKGTRFSQFEGQVSYCLYYIDKWMTNTIVKRTASNWKETASKYTDHTSQNLNQLYKES